MRPGETTPRTVPHENGVPPTPLPNLPAVPEPGASDLPPALTNPPGVDNLMATLRRRWPLILTLGITGAILAFTAVWMLVPGRFAATIIFGLTTRNSRGDFEGDHELATFSRQQAVAIKNHQMLQELLVRSAVAELREVQEHGADVAWLKSSLVVDQPVGTGPETMRVTLQGEYPEDIAILLNELAKAYIERQTREFKGRGDNLFEKLSQQLNEVKAKLSNKQKEISELQRKLGLDDQRAIEAKIASLEATSQQLRLSHLAEDARRRELQDEVDRFQEQMKNPGALEIPLAEIDDQVRTDATLRQLSDQLAQHDELISRTAGVAAVGNKERAVAHLMPKREGLLEQLRVARARLLPALEGRAREKALLELRKKAADTQRGLDRCNTNLNVLQGQITGITQQLNQLKTGNDARLMQTLTEARTEEKQFESSRDELVKLVNKIDQDRTTTTARITVLEESQPPKERTIDRKLKYGAAAAIGAFGVAFMLVALLDFRMRRVNSVQDIAQGLGLPVVGTLPLVPNRDARQLLMLDDAEANPEQLALREAVDSVRTVVLHAGRKQPLQVLLVASALHGEGKTTLASQLATSLARSGRRTLLLDCDLRNPSVAELFNRPGIPGVCEVLRGEVPVEDAIQPTEQAQLFLVPGGHVDDKALQALARDVPGTLIDSLREHFDFIVIDSSPVLPVSDALQIATHADAVVMAIMEQTSQLPAVHQAQQKLSALQIRVIGAVVGGTKAPVYLYGSRNRTTPRTKEAGS